MSDRRAMRRPDLSSFGGRRPVRDSGSHEPETRTRLTKDKFKMTRMYCCYPFTTQTARFGRTVYNGAVQSKLTLSQNFCSMAHMADEAYPLYKPGGSASNHAQEAVPTPLQEQKFKQIGPCADQFRSHEHNKMTTK
jgi:hypothetical protein